MKLLFLYLNKRFGSETVFHSWAADVKEMYDWLPQADILRAVKWALSYVSKKYRRTSVAVFFKSTKQSRIGKSYLTDEAVNISFQDIFSVCEFEVSNAYFSLNCVIFLQLLGCPQGGPGSPGLAWWYAYFMNISLDAAFMTIRPSCFSFVILTTSEQLLSIDPQTSPQNPLPSHFWRNFKLKPTILPCLWFLKSVRKTCLNFLKENLLLQMILCLVSGCQKTLTHSNNMAR